MTDFMITAPDGKKYKVSGADQAGAVAALKKMLGVVPQDENMQRARDARAGTLPAATTDTSAADQIAQDRMTLSKSGGFARGVDKAVQGLPFIGEYSDEITGAIGNMVEPGLGDRAQAQQRETRDAMDRQNPKTSAALQVAGGIAGSIPMVAAAGPAMVANAPASLFGKAIAGAGIGAISGGTEGAISGYGAGDDGDRAKSAAMRGGMGAVLGGTLGGAVPIAGAGIRSVVERMKGLDVKQISQALRINPNAAKVIKASLEADDFAAAEAAIKRAGGDAMLADAGPATSQLLDTAMQSGGAAARIGREAVEGRATQASKRVTGMLDAALGRPEGGVKAASKGIAQRTSAIRQKAYDRAYNSAIDYADDAGRNIEGVLQRIPPKTLNAAISEANDAMRAAGVQNKQIMAQIGDDGAVAFKEMPNVQQLDEIKKALGAIAQNETDAITGRITGAGIRAKKLAGDLRDAMGDAVGAYKTATRLGGDKIAEDQALDLGRKLLSSGTSREAVADMMQGASKEATAAAQKGLRQYVDDTLANVQRTLTDPNTDAREAIKLVKDMSSRANKEKVTAVIGDVKANRLFRALDEATAQLELRSNVSRNSATASRLAGQETVKEITSPGAVSSLMQGSPVEAAKKTIQLFTGQTAQAQTAKRQAIYAEVARALTEMRGPAAERALASVQRALSGQPIKSAEAALIGRTLATGGALTGYQLGQQLQK